MLFEVDSPKYGKKEVFLDKKDFVLIKRGVCLSRSGNFLYVRIKPKKEFLHRAIMGYPKNMVIDHINRNTLDNRRKNLRIVTILENLRNQKRLNNKTGRTGVSIGKNGTFTAQIKVNYKKIHLGSFKTIKDAYRARLEAEKKYYDTKRIHKQMDR